MTTPSDKDREGKLTGCDAKARWFINGLGEAVIELDLHVHPHLAANFRWSAATALDAANSISTLPAQEVERLQSASALPECGTCNDDPAVCATVPGLRHCEKANREPTGETPIAMAEAVIAAAERVSHLPSELCDFIRDQARELAEAKVQISNQAAQITGRHQYVGQDFQFRIDKLERELAVERDRRVNAELDRDAHKARLAEVRSAKPLISPGAINDSSVSTTQPRLTVGTPEWREWLDVQADANFIIGYTGTRDDLQAVAEKAQRIADIAAKHTTGKSTASATQERKT